MNTCNLSPDLTFIFSQLITTIELSLLNVNQMVVQVTQLIVEQLASVTNIVAGMYAESMNLQRTVLRFIHGTGI